MCLQPAGDDPPQAGHPRAKCWDVKPPALTGGGKDLPVISSSTGAAWTMSVKITLSTFWTTLNTQTFPLFSPECWSLTSGSFTIQAIWNHYKGLLLLLAWLFVLVTGSLFSSSGWLVSLAPPVRDERSRGGATPGRLNSCL